MIGFEVRNNGLFGLRKIFDLFPQRDKKKLIGVTIIQVFLSLLDLAGVALIGVLGALAVNGLGEQSPGDRVSLLLRTIKIESLSLQAQAIILGILACFFLTTKTLLAMLFLRKMLRFLSHRASALSSDLLGKLLSQSLPKINRRSRQETLYSLTSGVQSVTIGVVGTLVSMLADASLLLILSIGLFIVDPIIAICTFMFFVAIGFSLYRTLQVKAKMLGKIQAETTIRSNESILELLDTYREQIVRHRRGFYLQLISSQRRELAETAAQLAFMPFIGKYILEIAMVFGALLISILQFSIESTPRAVATLSIFLVASSRIAPAVLRIQHGLVTIKGALVSGQRTLNLADELSEADKIAPSETSISLRHLGFIPEIHVMNLCYTYPDSQQQVLSNVSFNVDPGEMVAIVGPSGAGKSTLVDLILGVMEPTQGEIRISGINPRLAIGSWPGAIAYVPQDIRIVNGTIRQNVLLGFKDSLDLDNQVWEALKLSSMEEFVAGLPKILDNPVGDMGSKLSGGQRQRLGIARALISNPSLIVFDEATSSLDSETEAEISTLINNLRGLKTTIIIAHRLSTVRRADKVLYIENGVVLCSGTFEHIRKNVPNFDKQARLMEIR